MLSWHWSLFRLLYYWFYSYTWQPVCGFMFAIKIKIGFRARQSYLENMVKIFTLTLRPSSRWPFVGTPQFLPSAAMISIQRTMCNIGCVYCIVHVAQRLIHFAQCLSQKARIVGYLLNLLNFLILLNNFISFEFLGFPNIPTQPIAILQAARKA